jgi:integrase/recombinase XerD
MYGRIPSVLIKPIERTNMIFHKQYTKALPADATIKRGIATWKDRTGRSRKAPVTKNGDRILLETANYYIRFADKDGIVHEVAGYRDREATKVLEGELLTKSERGEIGMIDPYEEHKKRPISEHIEAFEVFLDSKGNTPSHVSLTVQRVNAVIEGMNATALRDVTASRVAADLSDRRQAGLSIESSNHYLRAMRNFVRWMVKDRRLAENPIAHLTVQKADKDRRHARRPLVAEELKLLVAAANHRDAKAFMSVTGKDRAVLYQFVAYTGLRAGEAASLTPQSFSLESSPSTVRVAAGSSKHREEDTVPIREDVAVLIRAFVADKPLDGRLWKGNWHKKAGDMISADLDRARAAWIEAAESDKERKQREDSSFLRYEDHAHRFADFHAVRTTFISELARAGVHPKAAQGLARHKEMSTTMKHYTMMMQGDLSAALSKLPSMPEAPKTDSASALANLAATGTDDAIARYRIDAKKAPRKLALRLAPESGNSWQNEGKLRSVECGVQSAYSASPSSFRRDECVAQLVEQRTFNP